MKKAVYGLMAIGLFLVTSCGKDDGPEKVNTIVTTSDVTAEIKSDLAQGATVATVTGSSNEGAVSFSIASQTPQGVLAIGATDGVLTVADASALSALGGTELSAVVNVSKNDVSKTSNVTITVTEAIFCSASDVTPWEGTVYTKLEGQDSRENTGLANDCGILSLTGFDPLYYLLGGDATSLLCDTEVTVNLQLIPSESDGSVGTIVIEKQDYVCFDDLTVQVSGTGTYDTATTAISLEVTFEDDNGEFSDTVALTVENPDMGGGTDTDGDGVLDDTDEDANDPCLPMQAQGYNKYDAENTIWAAADCDGDGTSNLDETINFTDPYVDDTIACSSTVDTAIWGGALETIEVFDDGFENEGSGTGISGCGTLTFSGDILGRFCDDTPSVTFGFTPDSAGATTGTVVVMSQSYSCYDGIEADTIEGSGTYDETTATITFDYSWFDSDFDETVTGTVTITKAP